MKCPLHTLSRKNSQVVLTATFNLIKMKLRKNQIAWIIGIFISALLSIPLFVGYLQYTNQDIAGKLISSGTIISLGRGGFDTFQTVYSFLQTVMSGISGVILVKFSLACLKRETATGVDLKVSRLANIHASLTSGNPSIAMFANKKSAISILGLVILALGFATDFYKSFMSISVVRFTKYSPLSSLSLLFMLPKFEAWSLSDESVPVQTPVNSNGAQITRFLPDYYFSKTPSSTNTLWSYDIGNGTIPLSGHWPRSPELSKVYSFEGIPAITMDIINTSYRLVNGTTVGTTFLFEDVSLPNTPINPGLLYMPSITTLLSCIRKNLDPWDVCGAIPESIQFRFVQRLPDFTGVYPKSLYTTPLFSLPQVNNGPNAGFPPSSGWLDGTLTIKRSLISFTRTGVNLTVTKEYPSNFPNATIESIFKKIQMGAILNFVYNLNSSVTTQGSFAWSQMEEFRSQGTLIYELRDYSLKDNVDEMIRRMASVVQFFVSKSKKNDSVTLKLVLGEPADHIVIGAAIIAAVTLLSLWFVFLSGMTISYFVLKKNLANHPFADPIASLWDNSDGLASLALNGAKTIVLNEDKGKFQVVKVSKTDNTYPMSPL
jgi:hypothetical protein